MSTMSLEEQAKDSVLTYNAAGRPRLARSCTSPASPAWPPPPASRLSQALHKPSHPWHLTSLIATFLHASRAIPTCNVNTNLKRDVWCELDTGVDEACGCFRPCTNQNIRFHFGYSQTLVSGPWNECLAGDGDIILESETGSALQHIEIHP